MTFDESPSSEVDQTDHEREVAEEVPGEGDDVARSRPSAEEDLAADMEAEQGRDEDR
jgi:hypothetical protein